MFLSSEQEKVNFIFFFLDKLDLFVSQMTETFISLYYLPTGLDLAFDRLSFLHPFEDIFFEARSVNSVETVSGCDYCLVLTIS